MRILVANRGEIARRIMRTAHVLGHETVAVFADPDAQAPFVSDATSAVRIGPADLRESYLSAERLLDAAARSGADAVHPGYGFLAENAAFARSVQAAGLVWIGPSPEAIDRMGSKIEARRLAAEVHVPIIPGYDASQDHTDLTAAADRIGYPVLAKASAGGGGKGIRIANGPDELPAALADASAEAERAFGDGALIVERYITRPRHVEVQVVGDASGRAIHLGTRECSVQRRYQKLLEEAPAPNLPIETRSGLQASAVELARSMRYDSVGTVEFIVDDNDGSYYFLEMNTRLQVEHPVTELVTGLDLVALQIAVADGGDLPLRQGDVEFTGHAFEARINAEDPGADFAPQIGTVDHLAVPADVRWDSGIVRGSEVSPFYDPMLAKLIAHGPDRDAARLRLRGALDHLVLGGVVTNAGFHRWLLDQPPVVAGRVTTRFLDETELPSFVDADADAADTLAAAAWVAAVDTERGTSPWSALGAFRVTPSVPDRMVGLRDRQGALREVVVETTGTITAGLLELELDGVRSRCPVSVDLVGRSVAVTLHGQTSRFDVVSRSERWAPSAEAGHGAAGAIVSPFPAVVAEVAVAPGDDVVAGTPVVTIEAMKMLHPLAPAGAGTVAEVRVAVGDQVASGQVLVTFEALPSQEDTP